MVASYAYSPSGQLAEEWDPRLSPNLKEKYTYEGRWLKTLTPAGLTQLINRDTPLIIDLSASADFEKAHVPGAKNVAMSQFDPETQKDLSKAKVAYLPPVYAGMVLGYVALWQKCPHLGCRVPWCQTSQWFECPCHGSKYDRVGEKKGGPAPRGLDRFVLEVSGGQITVDTATASLVQGPPIGTDTTGQTAEGAPCV